MAETARMGKSMARSRVLVVEDVRHIAHFLQHSLAHSTRQPAQKLGCPRPNRLLAAEIGITEASARNVYRDIQTKRRTTEYQHLSPILMQENIL